MGLKRGIVRAAVVQAAPVIMDRQGTMERIRKLTGEAAEQGARIILFPEAFIPCYPRGLSFGSVVGNRTMEGRKDWSRYYENSIDVPGPETGQLGELAAGHGVYLSIGVMEREGGTLFCTLLYFGPDGSLLAKHRKLKPTGSERLIWGEGDGSTLAAVNTPYGVMSGLICWENYMPLARSALYAQGIEIYLAPTAQTSGTGGSAPCATSPSRAGALFSRATSSSRRTCTRETFSASGTSNPSPTSCAGAAAPSSTLSGTTSQAPRGTGRRSYVPTDLAAVVEACYDFDVMGHYARPRVYPAGERRAMRGIDYSGPLAFSEEEQPE